jgi:hypothetical protein
MTYWHPVLLSGHLIGFVVGVLAGFSESIRTVSGMNPISETDPKGNKFP